MAVGIIWSSCFNILVKYVVDWTTLGSRESWRGGRQCVCEREKQWDLQSVSGGATAWETVPSIDSARPVCGRELRLYVHWLFCWNDFFFPLFWMMYFQLTDLNKAVNGEVSVCSVLQSYFEWRQHLPAWFGGFDKCSNCWSVGFLFALFSTENGRLPTHCGKIGGTLLNGKTLLHLFYSGNHF